MKFNLQLSLFDLKNLSNNFLSISGKNFCGLQKDLKCLKSGSCLAQHKQLKQGCGSKNHTRNAYTQKTNE